MSENAEVGGERTSFPPFLPLSTPLRTHLDSVGGARGEEGFGVRPPGDEVRGVGAGGSREGGAVLRRLPPHPQAELRTVTRSVLRLPPGDQVRLQS